MAILTLTQYKEYKSINSDKQDVQISKLIDASCSFISSYCRRTFTDFYTTSKVEYFDATESEIYPSEYPFNTITAIDVSTDAGQTYGTTLVEFTDYVVDNVNSRIVSLVNSEFVSTSYPINAIKVTYTGGFSICPADLVLAAVNLVEYYMDEQYTPSKSMIGASVDNALMMDPTARLPAHIRRVLEHYRSANL